MGEDIDADTTVFKVVVNDDEQFSIWPTYLEIPPGWRDTTIQGSRTECLRHIEQVWSDLRPLRLRTEMGES